MYVCMYVFRVGGITSLKASGHGRECVTQSKYAGRRHKKMRGEGGGETRELGPRQNMGGDI